MDLGMQVRVSAVTPWSGLAPTPRKVFSRSSISASFDLLQTPLIHRCEGQIHPEPSSRFLVSSDPQISSSLPGQGLIILPNLAAASIGVATKVDRPHPILKLSDAAHPPLLPMVWALPVHMKTQ